MTLWNFFTDASMGQNIVSEVIGIALTVFLVDKIIQRRDNLKLLPTKQVAYAQLLHSVNEMIELILPIEFREISSNYVIFGKFEVLSLHKINDIDYYEIQESIRKDNEIVQKYDLNRLENDKNKLNDSIKSIASVITNNLMRHNVVLNTPHINLFHKAQFEIDQYLRAMSYCKYDSDDYPSHNSVLISAVLKSFVEIKTSLEKSADETISAEEKLKRIKYDLLK